MPTGRLKLLATNKARPDAMPCSSRVTQAKLASQADMSWPSSESSAHFAATERNICIHALSTAGEASL
eukprot:363897-Chlamydomonas_euryale.AAC.20